MTCIIVLGCYRSGTSAVAGVLQRLGVFMGDRFDKPTEANPTGYYEDLDFKRLFDMLSEGRDVGKQIEILSKIRSEEHVIWGFKDPQICFLMQKLVPLIKADLKVIVCRRPKEEIADSLSRAMRSATNYSVDWLPLVEQHVNKLNEFLIDFSGPVLHVEWGDMKADPSKDVKRVADFVGLPFNERAAEFINSIA